MLGPRALTAILAISVGSLTAQQPRQTTAVSVPFVGCPSDGQTGPVEAPSGQPLVVPIQAKLAHRLAYYSSDEGFGVLAPRGWNCFGTYGSGGESLIVSPQPVDFKNLLSDDWSGYLGPAVQLNYSYGGTSGRFNVAEIIARVFPAYRAFATIVAKGLEPPYRFPSGPYPKDKLTYKSKASLKYRTPAQTDGLGTHNGLEKNDDSITGVAMLVEGYPDLLLLSVRLPQELTGLSTAIIQEVEREAARRPRPDVVR